MSSRRGPLPRDRTDHRRRVRAVPVGHGPSGPSPALHRSITESFFVLGGTVRLHDGRGWVDAGHLPGRRRLVQRDRLRATGLARSGLRIDGGAGRLAARAPPGHPLLQVWPLLAEQDRGAAAEAGLPATAEHPVVAAAARIAGGVLLGVVQVGPHERAAALDQSRQALDVGDPHPRVDAERRTATRPCRGCRSRPGCAGRPARRRSVRRGCCAAGAAPRRGPSPARGRRGRGGRPAGPPRPSGSGRCRAGDSRRTPTPAWPGPCGRRRPDRRATSCPAGRCASCRPSGSGSAACDRRPAGSAGACPGARPPGRWPRSGRRWRAGGSGTHRGAASRRPGRCSSAGRPATRCLLRARPQCPRAGSGLLTRCETPDNRDDLRPARRCKAM